MLTGKRILMSLAALVLIFFIIAFAAVVAYPQLRTETTTSTSVQTVLSYSYTTFSTTVVSQVTSIVLLTRLTTATSTIRITTTTVSAAPPILSIILQITCTSCTKDYFGNYFTGSYDNGTQSYSVSSTSPTLTIVVERGAQTSWSVYWSFSLSGGTMEVKATLNSGQLISDKTATGPASVSGDFSLD